MTETLHASAPPAPAAPAAEPRYAFVLYDSRSGSTLFAALLNRYRGVSVSLESAFVSRVVEYGGPLRSAADLEALADYLFAEVQFAELGLARPEVVAALRGAGPPYGKRELARALLELYFGRRDPEALVRVVKNPPFFYVGLLEEWLPGVRFVHVVRDGRAVYNSKRSSRSISGAVMQPNLVKAARDWRRAVRIAERHPASVLTVRYEDLVRDPDAVMARVLDHLGVPPEGRALAKAQGDYHAQIGQAQRHLHENVARPPRPELQDRWRAELRPAQVALYERLAGAELRRHGYPLLGAGGAAPLAVAAEAAASWGEFALHRVRNTLRAFLVTGGSGEKLRRRWSRWTRGRGAGG